jgi:hypothetical protein
LDYSNSDIRCLHEKECGSSERDRERERERKKSDSGGAVTSGDMI